MMWFPRDDEAGEWFPTVPPALVFDAWSNDPDRTLFLRSV